MAAPSRPELKVKEYKRPKDFENDSRKMLRDGWRVEDQSAGDKKVAVGTTLRNTILTGGVGLLLGGRAHKEGKIRVTWVRGGEPPTKTCPRCAESVQVAATVCRFCQYDFTST